MLKAMMFMDGTWFDTNLKRLGLRRVDPKDDRVFIEHIDFRHIADAVRRYVREVVGFEVDLVRTYCVAGYPKPETVELESQYLAGVFLRGWNQVTRFPGVALDLYGYDYLGEQLFPEADKETPPLERRARTPKEKCVDVALATKMLYLAALPAAYDGAVLVTGDRDFVPVVQAVRNLGKRMALATFTSMDSCSRELKGEPSAALWDVPPFNLAAVLREQFPSPLPK